MKKNYIKKIHKRNLRKKKIVKDLRMLLLQFHFVMVYIIQKKIVLLKNYLNYFKDNIFEFFF